jgi:tetratricopeptide (TPR) repeat protein
VSRSETNRNYEELITECDLLIKAGKISAVTHHILRLTFTQVPRASRQGLAKICRRINLIGPGLRLLQPVMNSEKQNLESPTDGEICEYAVLLSRNGSIREASELLKNVDPEGTPEASLYLAYCHISNWDYANAVPLIERFLKSDADHYTKLVARVNLIPAYLATLQLDSAEKLLAETIAMAKNVGATRLLGNCLEMEGRYHLYRGDFSKSRASLNRALEIFGSMQIYDRLFINKWQALMTATETGRTDSLLEFRKEAIAQKDWETIREADLFIAKVKMDQKLLDYLIFGTPMTAYRERILQETGGTPSQSFLLGKESAFCLDLKTGRIDNVDDFNPGKKIHQVIASLVKDFYVPRNIGTLFSDLYPNDYFDINSSPNRVRALIERTRKWLKANDLPAQIIQAKGHYSFEIHGAFGVRLSLESLAIDSPSMFFEQLKLKFPPGTFFTAPEACSTLNRTRSSFLRLVEQALEKGLLIKSGQGRATRYEILKSPLQRSAA